MGNEEDCNTGLCLAVGVGGRSEMNNNPSLSIACVDLSITRGEVMDVNHSDFSQNLDKSYSRRRKLRLTKEQSTLLEDSFKLHSTPNSSQKRALAERLNLTSRQVEVWFQNRRARTKLKQTEVNCQLLKTCCENLSDENRRLKKELQELRSQLIIFKAMCPSCEKMVRTSEGRK